MYATRLSATQTLNNAYIPDYNARSSLCESHNYMPDTDWIWPSTKYKWILSYVNKVLVSDSKCSAKFPALSNNSQSH